MIKKILILLTFTATGGFLFSQDVKQIGFEQNVLYHNEYTLGFTGHSGGFGFDFRRAKAMTAFKKFVWEIEFVNMRHLKEKKTYNPYFDNPRGFFYGKLNSLLILRPGVGLQKIIYGKADGQGVEIRYIAFTGVSLGFAKPVYLEIIHETITPTFYDLHFSTEKYDPDEHFVDNIYGRAGFFKGIGETKIYPGAYAKLGLSLEYGSQDDDVRAIEAGFCVDVYPKTVPLMAFARNHQTFVSLYIQLLYGRKWY